MTSIALRDLRHDASELVRRAEAGESIEITVQGRPMAMLVPHAAHAHKAFISKNALQERIATWSNKEADASGWQAQAHTARDDDPTTDPWAR